MPIISIIVPVYNVEKYLNRCVDSILMQTFTDFECILINDGSSDNCPAICDEYAGKDNRIIVIHQKNAGVSAARNAGLDIAKGEWIGFVDSDDWCDPGMFEFLYMNAVNQKVDISICGIRWLNDSNVVYKSLKKCSDLIMNNNDALLKYFSNRYFGPYSVNKLVNKCLFNENDDKLRYDETIKIAEDRLLFFQLIKRASKVFYSSLAFYNCYHRIDSATNIIGKKGITEASLTAFNAYEKMLLIEISRKIRNRILAYEGIVATRFYLPYIISNNFKCNDKSIYLKKIVKKNIGYIVIIGTFREKLMATYVLIPLLFKLRYKILKIIREKLKR